MIAETLSTIAAAPAASEPFASTDRAALLARMYGPHGGLTGRVERICREHRRRRDDQMRAEARAQREGVARVA